MDNYIHIIVSTTCVYFFIIVALRILGKTELAQLSVTDLIFAGNVDEFWVLGENTQPPFDQLSVQERQLIKWKYVDGKKSSDIAAKITEHPNTVREHISKVKIKLKDILLSDGMEEFLLLTNIERK